MQCPIAIKWRRLRCLFEHVWQRRRNYINKISRWDGTWRLCIDRESFQAIPHIPTHKDQQIIVIIEGKWPLFWSCKQLGQLARYCPQKTSINNSNNNNKTISIKTTLEPEDHPNNPEEGWTQVTRRKKAQKQEIHKTIESTVEPKQQQKQQQQKQEQKRSQQQHQHQLNYQWPNNLHHRTKKKKKSIEGEQCEEMEITVNLKRRKDSRENQTKKLCTPPPIEPQDAWQEPPAKFPFSPQQATTHHSPLKEFPTKETPQNHPSPPRYKQPSP